MKATLRLLMLMSVVAAARLDAMCPATTLEEQFSRSSLVFVGRATSRQLETAGPPSGWKTVTTFDVEEVWKGTREETKAIRTCGAVKGDLAMTCSESFDFRVGETYLVFGVGEPLQTSSCEATAHMDRAGATLARLAQKPSAKVR